MQGRLAPDFFHQFLDMGGDEAVGALVLRFLLAPDNLRVCEAPQFLCQRLLGKRIKLFEPQQHDVVLFAYLAFFHKVVIDLAAAQHDALDRVVIHQFQRRSGVALGVVPQDAMKGRAGAELGQLRHRALVAQQ